MGKQEKKGNPNYAGLFSRKMKRLWETVKISVYQLRGLGQKVQNHRANYHRFYLRWADKPPVTHQSWSLFWAEFRALEGDLEKWYSDLSAEADELLRLSDDGQVIVANHEKVHPDDFIAFGKSLDRLLVIASEAKSLFESQAMYANGLAGKMVVEEEE